MKKTNVGIVGLGNVGTGVAKLLLDQGDRTAKYAGRTLWLKHIVVKNLDKQRSVDLPSDLLTDRLDRLVEDDEVSVVAQLIGGVEPARTIMLRLLESGKDIVTANKALLAVHGSELFERARELGRSIAFEASVAGGVPIIANIGQCLAANQITSIRGILNGTSNFIISRMDSEGADYDSCVAEAQRLGFAEADPAMDVDGSDAAQKLAILAQLAFGVSADWSKISRRGIDQLDSSDIKYAKQIGYHIKLIAFGELSSEGVQLMVAPMLIRSGKPMAEVNENFNAISVVGDSVGPVFFHGQGAGQMPTASAVVADLIDTAVGRTKLTFQTLKLWSSVQSLVSFANTGELQGRFYLRFNVNDQSGVLAQIAGILGDHDISIASVYQHDLDISQDGVVPLVIVTHLATHQNIEAAITKISKLENIKDGTERLKILD
jgi:homoserine dehydrogenase